MSERYVIFRDGKPLATTDNVIRWYNMHQPMSMDWAEKHEGYRTNSYAEVKLCATCLGLIESGAACTVVVGGSRAISVHVHDDHRVGAKEYPGNPKDIITRLLADLPAQ
jgi:hypothetical protein